MHAMNHATGRLKPTDLRLLASTAASVSCLCLGLAGCGDGRAEAASDTAPPAKPDVVETRENSSLVAGRLLPEFPEDLLPTTATFNDPIKIVHLRQLIARRLDGCAIDRDWPAIASVSPSACGRGWDISVEYESVLEYGAEWIVPIQAAAESGPTLKWFTGSQEEAESWLAHEAWAPVRLRSKILRTWVDAGACWGHPGVRIVLDMSAASRPDPNRAGTPTDLDPPGGIESLAKLEDQFPAAETGALSKTHWTELASSCVGKEFTHTATVTAENIERRDGHWVATLRSVYAAAHGWHSNFHQLPERGRIAPITGDPTTVAHSWQHLRIEPPDFGGVQVSLKGTGTRSGDPTPEALPGGVFEARVRDPWVAWRLSRGIRTEVSMRLRVAEAWERDANEGVRTGDLPGLHIVLGVDDVDVWQ